MMSNISFGVHIDNSKLNNNFVKAKDIFSTAIWESKLPDFEKLKESFLNTLRIERKNNPNGQKRSNYNGYHSVDTLAVKYKKEFEPLFHHVMEVMIHKIITDCNFMVSSGQITSCWANFNEGGFTSNGVHIHGGTFSGVFYINAPPGSGDLVFLNLGMNNLWEGCFLPLKNVTTNKYIAPYAQFKPQEGSIYLWNSTIPHYVNPNSADVERVSMSFNIKLQ